MIKVRFENGEVREYRKGVSLLEVLETAPLRFPRAVLAVKVDNKVYDLRKTINRDCSVEFLDLSTRDGFLVYQRSLCLLLVKAVEDVFPDLFVTVNHSLSKGLYCTVFSKRLGFEEEPIELKEEDCQRIKQRMKELVEEDIPFIRVDMDKERALRYFERKGLKGKVELLKFLNTRKVSVYQIGNLYDHFYGVLAPGTGVLRLFDIKPYPPGFILRFPTVDEPDQIPEFFEQRKMFQVFQEYEEWAKLMGVRYVADLNKVVKNGWIRELTLTAESLHEKRIAQIADMIKTRGQVRIVLVSGPTSSGKTTFSRRLAVQLRVVGINSFLIHLDDYFVEREKTPRDESGELDFEAFEAINVKRFQQDLKRLLSGREVRLPRYNFRTGMSEPGPKVKLDRKTLIIVEGIHGLNQRLTPEVPDALKYKIYVSAFTQLNLDEHNRISTSDVRVLRRLIRDQKYRGYTAVETIRRWPLVRRGEESHIFPYQESADVMFNSALMYEVGVLRPFSWELLSTVSPEEPVYSEARRLIKFVSYFLPIDEDYVLPTSILREFIGDSCFEELRYWEQAALK